MSTETIHRDQNQFCTFHVDQFFFGVEVSKVQEVVRQQALTRVPLAPREVSGLMNLRGQIVTAIDLHRRLGLPERSGGQPCMNVLISTEDGAVSLLVDRIEDVLSVEPDSVEPAPETLQVELRRFIRGVSKQKDRLLLILDDAKAMDLSA
ncbi:MAG: chemotaxis protein CheW [Verrucomicrobia bacterium]|nr:chemotaxis protein CheW [Verrucomicrobiota bacterium]